MRKQKSIGFSDLKRCLEENPAYFDLTLRKGSDYENYFMMSNILHSREGWRLEKALSRSYSWLHMVSSQFHAAFSLVLYLLRAVHWYLVLTGNHSTVIFPTLSPHIKCNVGVAMCAAPKNHSWAAGEAGSCRRELLRSQSWSVQDGKNKNSFHAWEEDAWFQGGT